MTDILWQTVNRLMVAKCISELHYEQCFEPLPFHEGYRLQLESGVCYQFAGWCTVWNQVRVDADSLVRDGKPVDSAGQFFIDARSELKLDDIVLANLLEECAHTLTGDMQNWRLKVGVGAAELADMDVDLQQPYLDGHPKAVLNKGRLGWGVDDLERYAPEYHQSTHLRWLAVQRELCDMDSASHSEMSQQLIRSTMSEDQWHGFCMEQAPYLNPAQWVLVPVHPWQWQQKLKIHYRQALAMGDIVDLGQWGARFLPLQSIRTLANIDDPQAPNVKLSITILNTSCYRGIPGKYITVGGQLSRWLSELCAQDPVLESKRTVVLEEPMGVHVPHPLYQQIPRAPYRFHEMLGVIWRDSVQSKLADGEQAMLMAALLQTDNAGDAVIRHLIERSKLTASAWLDRLFDAVVVPLYHLLCQYGVGLVAHGQNLTLILQNGIPRRLALKDLQGDMRIVDQSFPELATLEPEAAAVLTRLPPEYLIHDLQTGHFVTVLRYLSALMQEQGLAEEPEFYLVLTAVIQRYQAANPHLRTRFDLFDLLTPRIKRVCINRVRFKEGYGDNAERPLPTLGTDLDNPLYLSMQNLSMQKNTEEYAV